ncbi:GNAT family N-acetyltransferase [uncultured Vagococcus sp.]|uniref:GNAT family N-acetyltransferase n=1 Tax=uncultured Vagococcus sp. TaxID=189676 RepID=UPI0028D05C45|nr:GNAT family N-acetyltransferase [uncultured Vagococcus sp.]
MLGIRLVEPTISHKKTIISFKKEFPISPNGIEGTSQLAFIPKVEDWLDQIERNKHWESIRDGWVPGIQYVAVNQEEIVVGMLNLRLTLNDYLLNYGGHIGYSVRPSQRSKGYGSEMLKLALLEAKNQGLSNLLLTCQDDNIASATVILNNQGIMEDKRWDPHEGNLTRRYWINC